MLMRAQILVCCHVAIPLQLVELLCCCELTRILRTDVGQERVAANASDDFFRTHSHIVGRDLARDSCVCRFWLVAPDANLAGALASPSDIVRRLHAHQRVHAHAERLLDP